MKIMQMSWCEHTDINHNKKNYIKKLQNNKLTVSRLQAFMRAIKNIIKNNLGNSQP